MDKLTAEQKDVAEAAVLQLVLKMRSLETPVDNSDCMDSPAISSSEGDDSYSDKDTREAGRYFKLRTQMALQCSRIQIRKSRSSMAYLLLLLLTAVSWPAPKKRKEFTPKVSKH
jgi:hypothetical protein